MITVEDKVMSSNIRQEAKTILESIRKKASKAGLHYVVCYWMSPFCNLEYRVGYFEEYVELVNFKNMLQDYYEQHGVSFYITSDFADLKCGGLFYD